MKASLLYLYQGDSAIERHIRLDFASGWSNFLSRLCLEFAHDIDFALGSSRLCVEFAHDVDFYEQTRVKRYLTYADGYQNEVGRVGCSALFIGNYVTYAMARYH